MWPELTAMCVRSSHDKAPAPTVSTKSPPDTINVRIEMAADRQLWRKVAFVLSGA
jgi:hypothetical protein